MAWNGSNNKMPTGGTDRTGANRSVGAKRSSRSRPRWTHGLIAGLLVIAGAGIAVWLLGRQRTSAPIVVTERSKAPEKIEEVKPAKASVPKPTKRGPPKGLIKQRVGEVRNGYRLMPSGELYKIGKVMTNSSTKVTLADKIFDQPTDQTIGNLLTITPGASFLGDSKDYYKNFDRLFRESLKTEIVINADDSDEVKELKKTVIDARAELKAKMDAGEDVNQIMRDTRDQMRELGLYREEIEKQISDIIRNHPEKEFSKQDVADLIEAANTMLKERGASPVRLKASMAYQLHRASLRKKKLETENMKTEKGKDK